jgi:WXXGXW repeat (2 copies)
MNLRRNGCLAGILGLALIAVCWASGQPDQPPPPPAEEAQTQPGVEVQTSGPVHEAYAEPPDARPEPTPLITKEPPAAVDEVPPDQRPEGGDDVWIPGYWAYDDDAGNFEWVSGVWRVPPPGRQWVPGSWQEVEGGWHWIPGYWAEAGQDEAEYLPAPPPSLDNGASSPAPDEASDYVTGCWVYREGRYRWRPGFWLAHRPGWCWTAPHYVWCTLGYTFVDGYWDRPLLDRGLLFAPVQFEPNVVTAAGFQYTPSFAVLPDFLLGCLFARPANCHYYFGDYFDERYSKRGYVPWVDFRVGRAALDPNFAYYRGEFAHAPGWERNLRALYADRFSGAVPRPPRTLVQQTTVLKSFSGDRNGGRLVSKTVNITNVQNATAVVPLRRINNAPVTALAGLALAPGERPGAERRAATDVIKLTQVTREERTRDVRSVAAVRELAKQRADGEARLLREGAEGKQPADARRSLRLDRPKDVPWLNVPGAKPAAPAPEKRPEARPEPRPDQKPPTPVEKPRPAEPAPPRAVERPLVRPAEPVRQPQAAPQPAPRRAPPPQPELPKHEDRPIPEHKPPPAPRPPAAKPAPPPPAKAEPPHKEEPKKK